MNKRGTGCESDGFEAAMIRTVLADQRNFTARLMRLIQ